MSVCLSVCMHISGTTCPNFTKFSVYVDCTVAWSLFGSIAIHSTLPLLWMTFCYPTMDSGGIMLQWQLHCGIVYIITPLLQDIIYILDDSRCQDR